MSFQAVVCEVQFVAIAIKRNSLPGLLSHLPPP